MESITATSGKFIACTCLEGQVSCQSHHCLERHNVVMGHSGVSGMHRHPVSRAQDLDYLAGTQLRGISPTILSEYRNNLSR